jgi:hypothetical protein
VLLVTLNSSPNVTGQAQSLATVTLENLIMSKHKLTYLEMYPEALPAEEPSDLVIIAGAVALLAGLGFVLIVLFSL